MDPISTALSNIDLEPLIKAGTDALSTVASPAQPAADVAPPQPQQAPLPQPTQTPPAVATEAAVPQAPPVEPLPAAPVAPVARVKELQADVAGIRKMPVRDDLKAILHGAAEKLDVIAEVTSGGQAALGEGGPRTGSTRHDHGGAADLRLRDAKSGRILDMRQPEDRQRIYEFIRESAKGGATGVGMGEDYMGASTMHIGFGKEAVWRSPSWVRDAYWKGRGERTKASVPTPHNVIEAIDYASRQTGISKPLLTGIAQAESTFDPNKTNPDSSALGLFQQLNKTWDEDLGKWGWKYGIRAGTSRTNPTAAALMAGERIKVIQEATQRELGRQATDTDVYTGWVLGQSGGPRFLKGLAQAPNAPAKDFASPEAVAANPYLFYEKGPGGRPDFNKPRTAQGLYDLFAKKITISGDLTPSKAITGGDTQSVYSVVAPPSFPVDKKHTYGAAAAIRAAKGEKELGFWNAFYQDITTRGLTARGVQALRDWGLEADPGFVLTPEMIKHYGEGLPTDMLHHLKGAVSEQHVAMIAQRKRDELAFLQQVDEMGWKGLGAQLLAAGLDPASVVVGAASGGLATSLGIAAKAGALGQRALQAGAGAAGNVAVEAGLGVLGGDTSAEDMLTSAAVGAIFGGLFGPIARNPATAAEGAELAALAKTTLNPPAVADNVLPHGAIDGHLSQPSAAVDEITGKPAIAPSEGQESPFLATPQSAGAAANPNAAPITLNDPNVQGIRDHNTPKARLDWLPKWMRIGMGSQLHASDNAMTRTVASAYAGSPVGMAGDAVNPHGADTVFGRNFKRWYGSWYSTLRPAFREWQEETGRASFYDLAMSNGWDEFNELVSRYKRETDPHIRANYPASVQRAADEMHARYEEARNLMQRHGVPGAETLAENPNYVNRVWSLPKIEAAIERLGGYVPVRNVIAQAIRNASPHLSDDWAVRFADAIMSSKARRTLGYDEQLDRLFSNADTATLADILRNHPDIVATEDEIQALLGQLRHTEPNTISNLKHRIQLNEKYVDQTLGLGIEDLLENNADRLMLDYLRKTAGVLALAQSRIVHPVTGEVIMEGVRSMADHQRVLRLMKQWAIDEDRIRPGTDILKQTEKDAANLDALYKAIVGIPHPDQLTGWAEWLRALRTLNFPIMMGELTFAMMMDTGRVVGALGLKAFTQHMRPYKRIVNGDGKWMLAHGIDHDLETILGTGTDPLRAFHVRTLEDAGDIRAFDRNRLVDKVQAVGDNLTMFVYHGSGAAWVDTQIKLMAGRAAAQRFADLAQEVIERHAGDLSKLSRADLDRLRFIGLDDEMALRVLHQIHDHASFKDGFLFGKKITQINLDNWTDMDAAAAFSNSLYKWTRHVVQEGDPGQLHRVMSSPVAQTLLQYRSFVLTAWENQLLHGIAHPDGRTALTFMWSMFTGGLVYAVQTQLQAIGRSDADEFLEKRLYDPKAFGAAVFQRAGFSSILPMLIDSALVFTPAGPVFNASTSGRPIDFVFGNPSVSTVENWRKGIKAVIGATVDGRDLSQQELRQVQSGIFLQNFPGWKQTFSVLISDRDLKPPRD